LKALRNILSDLAFQFRLRGGLFTRLSCVAGYYRHYGWARLQGHDRDESQNRAWLRLAEDGFMRKTVQLHWPPGMIMELDAVTASVIVREMVAERMYALLPEFVPEAGQTVVDVGGHQAPANQGLERRGERGAVGAEQGGDFGDAGRERAVEGVQQRELAAGQVQRAQRRIETAGQGAGGALGAQAKALVADEVGVGERVGG